MPNGNSSRNKKRVAIQRCLRFVRVIFAFMLITSAVGCSCSGCDNPVLNWKEGGLYDYLPKPVSSYGKVSVDEATKLEFTLFEVDADEYKLYVEQCREKGFSVTDKDNIYDFYATDVNGYRLEVSRVRGGTGIEVLLDVSEGRVSAGFSSDELCGLGFTDVVDIMESRGFINIQVKEKNVPYDSYATDDYTVASVTVGGMPFTSDEKLSCVAEVKVTYYKRGIRLGYSSKYLNGKHHDLVMELLLGAGFKNIVIEEIEAASDYNIPDSMNGVVYDLSINGRTEFSEGMHFPENSFIRAKYYNLNNEVGESSNTLVGQPIDRVLEKLEEWGFRNIELVSKKCDAEQVGEVMGISIGEVDQFLASDSFDRGATVTVVYGGIKVEKSAEELGDMLYTEAEEYLRSLGFENIKTEVSYLINGWINKPNEIKKITVNGDSKFDEKAVFQHDAEIIIVYYEYRDAEKD